MILGASYSCFNGLHLPCSFYVDKKNARKVLVLPPMKSTFVEWVKDSAAAKRYALITFAVCIAYYILECINGRAQMADFRVYYDAANAFLFDTQLYGKSFGVSSGFYKYSPFAAIPFIPLAIMPYAVASVIYYLLLTLAFIWWPLRLIYEIAKHSAQVEPKKTGIIIFLSVLFLADHIERELHLGNVNLFLLIASLYVYTALEKGQSIKAGIIFGIILLFKPHFVILFPYLIWKGKWKAVATSFITLFIGFLLPVVVKGWYDNLEIHTQWLQAMRDHNISLEDSANTIYGIFNRFLLKGSAGAALVIILLALTAAGFVIFLIRNRKLSGNNHVRFIEFFVLIAAIPNLAHTDTEHFMWTWPLIAYSIVVISLKGLRAHWSSAALMTIAFIPYCLNSPDIVGAETRWLFDEGGLLGVSNLILILVAIQLYMNQTKNAVRITE